MNKAASKILQRGLGGLLFLATFFNFAQENENKATPPERIRAPKGFEVELIHSVDSKEQGSWVNLCLDGQGHVIVSDQYGGLYRFAPPALGETLQPSSIKPVPANIRAVNGMLWAFDSLYVAVNDYERKMASGLYRLTDSNEDGELDKVTLLKELKARGDHGVHAVVLAPDGESLFLITGNNTTPADYDDSRVPEVWGEDHLLERMPDGRGHNRGVLAPGGIIYEISPDGSHWSVYSSGYRNIYDAAFNVDGELFTYDADMEYDFNTPWYRPTRVNHVTSGSQYGWRHGTGKRAEWYPDNLPGSVNIGPGSPTGVTFGYQAKFPAKYQKALYLLDWSWGKIYAAHLEPDGSSYRGDLEEFISGTPLPVTDAIINPADGAMYFTIGGRRVQSGLYRVTYTGSDSTAPIDLTKSNDKGAFDRALRKRLEQLHQPIGASAVEEAWNYLDHSDRFLSWAARTAIEHQPRSAWQKAALTESDPNLRVEALLALARVAATDPAHRPDGSPSPDSALGAKIATSLASVSWEALKAPQKRTLVRAYQIVFNRFGHPNAAVVDKVLAQLNPVFPSTEFPENWLLCETLAYLNSPTVAAKAIQLIQDAPTQEEQVEYARSLRFLQAGWTPALREAYFQWFLRAANYRGGASFTKFMEFIRNDAVASLSERDKKSLGDLLDQQPQPKSPLQALAEALAGRGFVKEWTLDELAAKADKSLTHRDFKRGRKMFGAAGCFACHRFANEGGMTGPDLSQAGGRYSARDLLDQIIHPNKEINEQFAPIVLTKTNGEKVMGVIVNLNGDRVTVNTDLSDPNQRTNVNRNEVASIEPSKISTMPSGLLNMLEQDEIMDLVAYILSGNDPNASYYQN